MTGRRLSHYLVAEEISRGGMGVVYRATDVRLNRDVAFKVLPDDLTHDAERKRRFLQEAQAASALEHPHIAVIHDVDEVDGVTFMAMELIRGPKLSDLVSRQRLSAGRVLELGVEIASGLARAHEKNIVHRDLKPANVMITEDGHAKIIDFGIAKLVEPASANTSAPTMQREGTAPGVVLGTMTYMSPEQTRGDDIDHRSDIFSFGILLHELLSGQPPFQGRSGIETASAILHEPAPRLPALGAGVAPEASAEIQRIVDKCLAKEPADRYQGMKDLIVDLRGARRRLDSTLHTAPLIPAAPRSRRLGLVAAAVAIVVGLALVIAWRMGDEVAGPIPASGDRTRPSVAVLYFENTTGNPQLDWLRTGITEMVVTDLSQSQNLEVVATEQLYDVLSGLRFEDARSLTLDEIREVAARTGVGNVVVGSYVKAGEAIRINVRLQDVQTGRILSSERVEGSGEASLFTMVDDLTRRLMVRFEALRAGAAVDPGLLVRPATEPAPGLNRGLGDVTTSSIDAYRHYAEGINLHERSREVEAAERFAQAVAIDPAFAMAYIKLAVVSSNLGNFAERDRYAALALTHADRLTPRDRYYIEGFAYSSRLDSSARSMAAYQQCLEIDPSHHACRHNLGLALSQLERCGESIVHYEDLLRRGTTNPTSIENLARCYVADGRVARAVEVTQSFLTRYPESGAGHNAHGLMLLAAGRHSDAAALFSRAALLDPGDPINQLNASVAQALAERWDESAATAAQLARSAEPTRRWFGGQLQMHLALYRGRSAEAMAAAEHSANAYAQPGQRSAWSRTAAAAVLLARGQAAQALPHLTKALTESRNTPQEIPTLSILARTLALLHRDADARQVIEELRGKMNPAAPVRDQRRLDFARGRVALALGDAGTAVTALEAAQATLPSRSLAPGQGAPHVPLWFALGEAYLAAGRDDLALAAFTRVTDAGYERFTWPVEFVRSFYYLGTLHEKRGDQAKALDAYRRFVGYWKDGDLDRDHVAAAQRKLGAAS